MNKPDPRILAMLQGPEVPADFVCDGCTMSPDGWFYWACRIHDYEAQELRHLWAKLSSGKYHEGSTSEKLAFENYYHRYKMAEQHLADNIRILSTFHIDRDGELRVRRMLHPKRIAGWPASKLYAGVTGSLWKWATVGKEAPAWWKFWRRGE